MERIPSVKLCRMLSNFDSMAVLSNWWLVSWGAPAATWWLCRDLVCCPFWPKSTVLQENSGCHQQSRAMRTLVREKESLACGLPIHTDTDPSRGKAAAGLERAGWEEHEVSSGSKEHCVCPERKQQPQEKGSC